MAKPPDMPDSIDRNDNADTNVPDWTDVISETYGEKEDEILALCLACLLKLANPILEPVASQYKEISLGTSFNAQAIILVIINYDENNRPTQITLKDRNNQPNTRNTLSR